MGIVAGQAASSIPTPLASKTESELTPGVTVTNMQQVRECARFDILTTLPVRLDGVARYVASTGTLVLLGDGSGLAPVELDLSQNPIRIGQRVQVSGWGRFGGGRALLTTGPVVNNDGAHAEQLSSGRRFLSAGYQPLRLVYYQVAPPFALTVRYEGPGISLRPIPSSVLFHLGETGTNGPVYGSGVEYKYAEGSWDGAPDFSRLLPLKTGVMPDFSLSPRQRDQYFAFEFSGLLRIEREGFYTFELSSDDGSLLFVGDQHLRVSAEWPAAGSKTGELGEPVPIRIGQPLPGEQDYVWSSVEGAVSFAAESADGWELELTSDTGRLHVVVPYPGGGDLALLRRNRQRFVGFCQGVHALGGERVAGVLLVPDLKNIQPVPDLPGMSSSNGLPVLTTAQQVRQLPPEEARREYPVRLRGVITDRHAESRAVIQDATSAVYLGSFPVESWRIPVGHYCELEGVSNPGGFAPTVFVSKAMDLGPGQFPVPIPATYDQLASGSLDCQWVEIEGMVLEASPGEMQVALRGGRVKVYVIDPGGVVPLNSLSNAFVRIRGCAVPAFNEARQVIGGALLRVPSASFISVDEMPPAEPFGTPAKRVAELLQFDPRRSQFKWVRVCGQLVLAARDWACLMDSPTNGLRFILRAPMALTPGDTVEVVGVPELEGASPLLRQAFVRKIGQGPLPPAPLGQIEEVLQGRHDATRLELQGLLVGARSTASGLALEIQAGLRSFEARVQDSASGRGLPPLGSRVGLVGVVLSPRRTDSGAVEPFTLWLSSRADVRCLRLPPRWTLKQALALVGVLAVAVLLAALWITLLRRRVEQRTRQWVAEMEERRDVQARVASLELLRALETERARIARNIHDDLGARVTRLSRLVGALRARSDVAPQIKQPLEDVSQVCRQMVMALDETVWTVNPTNDTIARLGDYITHFADEFFHGTGVRCELHIPLDLPEKPLTTEVRHSLFLVVKEALNNTLKHAEARMVTVEMNLEAEHLRLTIRDDGKGFLPTTITAGNGLANMRTRVGALGGRLDIETRPGRGTTVQLETPIRL